LSEIGLSSSPPCPLPRGVALCPKLDFSPHLPGPLPGGEILCPRSDFPHHPPVLYQEGWLFVQNWTFLLTSLFFFFFFSSTFYISISHSCRPVPPCIASICDSTSYFRWRASKGVEWAQFRMSEEVVGPSRCPGVICMPDRRPSDVINRHLPRPPSSTCFKCRVIGYCIGVDPLLAPCLGRSWVHADFRPTNISRHLFMNEQLSQLPDHQGRHTT
jgi:hypothetical protein